MDSLKIVLEFTSENCEFLKRHSIDYKVSNKYDDSIIKVNLLKGYKPHKHYDYKLPESCLLNRFLINGDIDCFDHLLKFNINDDIDIFFIFKVFPFKKVYQYFFPSLYLEKMQPHAFIQGCKMRNIRYRGSSIKLG